MFPLKPFFYLIICLTLLTCGNDSDKPKNDYTLTLNATNNVISNAETLTLNVGNPKQKEIKSIEYRLGGNVITDKTDLTDAKLGLHEVQVEVYFEGGSEVLSQYITIVNSTAPKVYGFNILNEYPHDITSYTQGLEFYNGNLYESTGQRGESKLRKIDVETGEIKNNVNLAASLFGEGLTVLNGKVYQLTWQSNLGFVYDAETLERKSTFKYGKSKEGWGLCNDGKILYKTDGTESIWTLDPETLVETGRIQAYTNRGKIVGLNELEWIDGMIYANRYQKNGVAIINPKNGAIEGVIDFSSLKAKVEQHPKLDVLNGIAYNPDTKTIFVTGKNWNKVFEVEIVDK